MFVALVVAAFGVAGCVGPLAEERAARESVAQVGQEFRPNGDKPPLPELRADSPQADFLRFAILNHPAVEAAYHDWRAAVAAIAPNRALPDPRLTFEADIADALMTLMPGVMFDVMSSGKRRAMAQEATAESEIARRRLLAQVQRTAAEFRQAWVELAYANAAVRIHGDLLSAYNEAVAAAGADYTTARGMTTLEAQVRLLNMAGEHHAEHESVAFRRDAARAKFKSALGLARDAANPPWPTAPLTASPLPSEHELWARALAANADLQVMRSMVEMALASTAVAERAGSPDFAVGVMADVKANPLMFRPQASITLPVWREKIAANIAAAAARRDAAVARVNAEQLNLAAELAQMLYMVREADRMIEYLDETALPNLETVTNTAAAAYQSGMAGGAMLAEARAMALSIQTERLEALRQRENAVADLLLMLANAAPDSAFVARLAPNSNAAFE